MTWEILSAWFTNPKIFKLHQKKWPCFQWSSSSIVLFWIEQKPGHTHLGTGNSSVQCCEISSLAWNNRKEGAVGGGVPLAGAVWIVWFFLNELSAFSSLLRSGAVWAWNRAWRMAWIPADWLHYTLQKWFLPLYKHTRSRAIKSFISWFVPFVPFILIRWLRNYVRPI